MPAGRSNATALLQKVNSQLRGERVPLKTKDEDELAAYLNSLTLKTQQVRSGKFEEHGDVSVSSGTDGRSSGTPGGGHTPAVSIPTAGKYLKKNPASSAVASQIFEKETLTVGKSKKSDILTESRTKAATSASSRVTPAVVKADSLTRAGRTAGLTRPLSTGSGSDSSFKGPDVSQRPGSADTVVGQDGAKFLKNRKTVDEDGWQSSRSPSPQHRRKAFQDGRSSRETIRTLGSHFDVSDQDSFAEFIHALSTSESSSKQPQNLVAKKQQKWRKKPPYSASHSSSPVHGSRSPSPAKQTPSVNLSPSRSVDFDMMNSLDSEFVKERNESDGSEDHFQINLMDVASLLPRSQSLLQEDRKPAKKHVENKPDKSSKSRTHVKESSTKTAKMSGKKEKKSSRQASHKRLESQTNLFDTLGLHMADELFTESVDSMQHVQADVSEESEIKTERSDNQRTALRNRNSHSETGNKINDGQNKASFRWSSPKINVSENSGVRSSVDKRKSHNLDVTDLDEYSDSFSSEKMESESISQRSGQESRAQASHDGLHRSKSHKIVLEETQVNVSAADEKGGLHQWNTSHVDVRVSGPYGLQYVDPAPIASRVVSADALEALTAYSPNMLALHEMMKMQLQLVQNFVDIQRRMYQSCKDGLKYDHKYTTLEDTKEYIHKHQKPRMTLKEALKHVEQEEGITQA